MSTDSGGGGGDDPKPKKRRKPPRGLEGFDTGYPEDQADDSPSTSTGAPRKPLWSESAPSPTTTPTSPTTAPTQSTPSAPTHVASGEVDAPGGLGEASIISNEPQTVAEASSPIVDPTLVRSTLPVYERSGSTVSAESKPTAIPDDDAHPYLSSAPIPSFASASASASAPSSTIPVASSSSGSSGRVSSSAPMSSSGAIRSGASAAVMADGDEVLPAQYAGTDLSDAVGAKKKKKRKRAETPLPEDSFDDFDGGKPKSRKTIIVSILSLVVGLGIAAVVFLGRQNSAWFYITCEPDSIVAQQGRSFPPWGESSLGGKQWAPIKIPPEAECLPLETENEEELSAQFRTMLVKRASILLTAKEVTKTDEANALLEQALLHTRGANDSSRNARAEIQRLLGDVVYWRASLKMHDASKALLDAAKQFDAAAQQRPRHVTDASTWAEYIRKVVGELEAGPSGLTQTFPPTPPPSEPKPPAPPGVALPVEPAQGSASEPPQPTPDAGLPTGGVLL